MLKIAITGPESVGKSTLAVELAHHYNGISISEFARDFIANLNRPYTYDDVCIIAQQQIKEYEDCEKNVMEKNPFVFFDTFLIITQVWFEVVYHKSPIWLESAIKSLKMDLYLLCMPDLPWIPDNVRENGNNREHLFNRYKTKLDCYGFKYIIISGSGESRKTLAIEKINQYLNEHTKIPSGT